MGQTLKIFTTFIETFVLKNWSCATHTYISPPKCQNNPHSIHLIIVCTFECNICKMLAMALYTHGIGPVAEAKCTHFEFATLALHLGMHCLISGNATSSHFPRNLSWRLNR